MGRGVKKRKWNEVFDEQYLAQDKDDRRRFKTISNTDEINKILAKGTKRGVVAQEVERLKLVSYQPDGKIQVNDKKVIEAAADIKKQALDARFYSEDFLDDQITDLQKDLGLTRRQAENYIAREESYKAIAVLSAAKAGDVKLDSYTKGILNSYAKGNWKDAVYGKQDKDGNRRFEQGRYFNELGFNAKESRSSSVVNTKAAKLERRIDFIQNVQVVRQAAQPQSRGLSNQVDVRENRFASITATSREREDFYTMPSFDDDPPF